MLASTAVCAAPKGSYVKSNSKYEAQSSRTKSSAQTKSKSKISSKAAPKSKVAKKQTKKKSQYAYKKSAPSPYAQSESTKKLARLAAAAGAMEASRAVTALGDEEATQVNEDIDLNQYTKDTSLLQLEEAEKEVERNEAKKSRIVEALAQDDFKIENISNGGFSINHVGPFKNTDGRRYYEVLPSGEKVALTIDPRLQNEAESLLRTYDLPYAAIVAIEPSTGKIKAICGYAQGASNGQTLVARSSFPAASLFKMITASAAVEKVGLDANTPIKYRGGTYALGKHNYLPSSKSDKQVMTLGQAMGKSCNPVFARVALNYLSTDIIKQYANNFGFGKPLAHDFPVNRSTISLERDEYSLARTAAGFGDAYISPVHAAAIVAALGNNGIMMRPYIVDGVVLGAGKLQMLNNAAPQQRVVMPQTSQEILEMMEATVTNGTARKHFRLASPQLRSIPVAAKTGTLSGKNPKGVYHWFTAVAPTDKPTIAISTLVIDSGRARINGAGLGKKFLEKVFDEGLLTDRAKSTQKSNQEPVS